MPLSSGSRLGSYEITTVIGAGGMGEVYRARDSRLGRDVAIKVLPPLLAEDPDALARFEREMTTLAALSHPHILAIHDVGREGMMAYAVTELLAGETLADVITRGPAPIRRALDYGVQVARGLAAAHDRGIVHRDVTPANIFVTTDGHVKVLDFGLARPASPDRGRDSSTVTGTSPGLVMGTVGYMAPEQARGLPVDHRSDIFAFGCVMYELVSGRRAFRGDSTADTLSAILKEDPPPLTGLTEGVPAALERIIQRCLEKQPAERFQSARDLAFALEAFSSGSPPSSGPVAARAPHRARNIAAAAAVAAALAATFFLGREFAQAPVEPVVIQRLTDDRGVIRSARFAPDGSTVVYGAAWREAPLRVFLGRTDTGESKPLDLPDGDVLALSKGGDMLLSLGRRYLTSWTAEGTLARGRLFSSSVREVLEHVRDADFLPGGALAIARRVNGRDRLEVPQGTVVFETTGYISHVRVAPDGQRVGFLEHPLYGDNRGYVAVYDQGKVRRLTTAYTGIEGLAWSRDGAELWFGGGNSEPHWMVLAVDAAADPPRPGRTVWHVPRDLLLHDIDAQGRVLLTGGLVSSTLSGAAAGDPRERDLSWGTWVQPADMSRDGRTLLGTSAGSDADYTVGLRRMDGAAAVQIGPGRAQQLSADGKWALSITPSEPQRVLLLPTGPGESRQLDIGGLAPNTAVFVPGPLKVAVIGAISGLPAGVLVDVDSGVRTELDLSALRGRAFGTRRYLTAHVAPDGALLAVAADDGKVLAWRLPAGSEPRELTALAANESFAGWSADPSRIYVVEWTGSRARVHGLDLSTGRRSAIRDIVVQDPAGMLMGRPDLVLSADAGSYAYGFTRLLSTLYLVTGLQ